MRVITAIVLLVYIVIEGTSNNVEFFRINNNQTKVEKIINNYVSTTLKINFIIHGWSENRTTRWYEPLTNALLAKNNIEIIQVDYGKIASQPYPIAVANCKTVANQISGFILNLIKNGVSLDNIEIIAHSMGGQIAGYVGQNVFEKTGTKLKKITALDPAGPLFEGILKLHGDNLDSNDAEIVYVLHTDGNLFGVSAAVGTIDIFPNGGVAVQPGCPEGNDTLFCSHHRSYWYYISALENPNSLIAYQCGDYQRFLAGDCTNSNTVDIGGTIQKEDHGKYFLNIGSIKHHS